MRHAIESIQASQVIRRRVVDQSAVFGSDEQVTRQVEISSATVEERGSSLSVRSRDVGRIENERARSCQHKWRPMLHGHTKNISGGELVRIVGYAKCVVIFCIRGPRVIDLNAVVTIEVPAVCGKNTAAVGGAMLNTVLRRLRRETAQGLNASFALESGVILLCEGRQRHQ